jgi:hypothetical protein
MTITGFEQIELTHYAQSWWIEVIAMKSPHELAMKPPRE